MAQSKHNNALHLDNFTRTLDGQTVIWNMDAEQLRAHLKDSVLATTAPALVEALNGATGVDLVSKCLEETDTAPFVRPRRDHHGDRLGKCEGVKAGHLPKLQVYLERLGLGFVAMVYRSCEQKTPLMDYRYCKLLGQGGFGVVYEVAHRHKPDSSPHVALKLVKATSPDDDDEAVAKALAKTAREMEHHQRVADSSEFIVSLLTWGHFGDEFFFVSMELCVGGDVAKLLEARQY